MYQGLTAKITVGAETVAYISNFSIEETKDIVEISKLGQQHKDKMATLYSWSASADGTADFETDKAQITLREALYNGDEVSVKFYLDNDHYLSGEAFVESFSLDLSAEDKGNISISLSGKDQLVYNTVPVTPTTSGEGATTL